MRIYNYNSKLIINRETLKEKGYPQRNPKFSHVEQTVCSMTQQFTVKKKLKIHYKTIIIKIQITANL